MRELINDDVELSAESNIVELDRQYDLFGSLEIHEWQWLIEKQLGISLSLTLMSSFFASSKGRTNWQEWNDQVVPTLTIAAMADFILGHAQVDPVEPVWLLVAPPSLAAGYFVRMTEVIQSMQLNAKPFGPSTRIREVLAGEHLEDFWNHFRLYQRSIPRLTPIRQNAATICCGLVYVLFLSLLSQSFDFAIIFATCVTVVIIGSGLRPILNPLPPEIDTFADLARELSERAGTLPGVTS